MDGKGEREMAHWLIPLILVGAWIGISVWLRPASPSSRPKYRSLRVASPILSLMIMLAVIGRPFAEYYRDHDWQSDALHPAILLSLGGLFLVCVYVSVGAMVYFFYRAIGNINFFAGIRVGSPGTAILMLVPVINVVAIPFVHYITYYRSMSLLPSNRVSAFSAAALAISTFLFAVVALAGDAVSRNSVLGGDIDPFSLSIVTFCSGLAAGILLTRLVSRIFKAQEAYAAHTSITAPSDAALKPVRGGMIDALRSLAVALLITVGVAAVVEPNGTASAVAMASKALTGNVTEPAASTDDALRAMAAELNKTGRQRLDEITWLDGATVESDRFVYLYSVAAERQSHENVTRFLDQIRLNITRGFCTEPSLQVFRDLNATVVYRYHYSDRTPLGEVAVANHQCQ